MYKKGFYGGKFMPLHKGHLYCVFEAASMCEELYVVLMYNGEDELDIVNNQDISFDKKLLSPHIRELALRKELKDFENIYVISYDCKPADDKAKAEGKQVWYYECEDMINLIGKFDAAFSSEPEYSELFKIYYPFADPVIIDAERKHCDISATKIRDMGFYKGYSYLAKSYQELINKKVLFCGTCSCGKSTMVKKLSHYYNTSFSEEWGKLLTAEFKGISSPGKEYYNEFICKQYEENVQCIKNANRVALLDTDAITTVFYSELYDEGPCYVGRALAKELDYDLILFFEPTVKFVPDGMRTHREQEQREELSKYLLNCFKEFYGEDKIKILDGNYEQNYNNAIKYIDEIIERE